VDEVESLVIERAKKVYGVLSVNVQPHSGSPANFAVYNALLNAGDTIMGLTLGSGGHLTHGAPNTASSKYYHSVQYNVGKDGIIDYEDLAKEVKKNKPKVIVAGVTAYPRILDWKKFAAMADKVGAYLVADISHIAGLVATGLHPDPVSYVHLITSTTHKMLRGPRGAIIGVTQKGLEKDSELAKKIDRAVFPGMQGGPHMNTIAGIAYTMERARGLDYKEYCNQILKNSRVLYEELKKAGLKVVEQGEISVGLRPYSNFYIVAEK
jgi:glycine hydroxymethyltransferase